MNVLKWTKGLKSGSKKETPNDVELQNVKEGTAFERVSNLETDSKWPGSSSASGSPSASRKELRKAIKKNLVHCDVLDDSGVESPKQMLAKRGYRMQDDVLGEGGFGKVILVRGARQDRLTLDSEQTNDNNEQNIKYACKIIDASDKFRKRLREFGNELSGLNAGHSHPNIIQLYDAFIIDRKFYIIMELGDGKSLHRYVKMHGPLSESRARRYFTQIGDAVNFLHAQNIAHRDIKMQNVLRKKEYDLASNRFQMVCKLADMGLATVIWTKDKGPVFLHTVAGTKFAFAPEILENDVYKKKKTLYSAMPVDIWAEGVILYEMLCKCLPFNPAVSSRMLELQKNRNFRFDRKRRAKPSEAGGRPPKPLPPLTEEVKHLIRMIFNPDPLARWTWREISRHPWIQRKSKEETRTG